jgi:hypothetical protein
MPTIHKTANPFQYSNDSHHWPEGRRFCVCNTQERIVIETYAARESAQVAVDYATSFYARHGVRIDRPIFEFVPGVGYISR